MIGGTDLLGTKNKFRFTGEAVDLGTGLVFLRARYYDPSFGGFLDMDSAHGIGSQYQYGKNNPLRYTDPLGRSSIDSTNNERTRELRVQMAQAQAESEYNGARDQIYGIAQTEIRDALVRAETGVLYLATGNVWGAVTSQAGSVNYIIQHTVSNGTVKSVASCATIALTVKGLSASPSVGTPSSVLGYTETVMGSNGDLSNCAGLFTSSSPDTYTTPVSLLHK